MKALSMVTLLTFGLVVSGCWDNEKEKRASDFMGGLTKCDDCKLDKPFLGSKKEVEP